MDCFREYRRWRENLPESELLDELNRLNEKEIEDAFYRELSFGTGGLRGVIGTGTNRMNTYTVGKASQGLSDYLVKRYTNPSVVIGFDSRIKSDLFAKTAASVFAANGITVHIWPVLLPVPTVSFAVRKYQASAGVMITASHNPSRYNGYKVYGQDGCQITTEAANAISSEISKLDVFEDVKTFDYNEACLSGMITKINDQVLDEYIEEVKKQSVLYGDNIDRSLSIVYTPLNGSGLVPVTRTLSEAGFSNISLVKEQQMPDGNFPTCPYPNPEIREAMEIGLQFCEKVGADLLIATDPDCDRCGIAVKNNNDYQLLSGNEVGILLLDFICSQREKHDKMPSNPLFVKTIVTMDLAEKIASHYGVETRNVLTGFKYIGEVIGMLEEKGRAADYIFGFEESFGYLTGTYVRDKDGVNAAFMICEMFAFYKSRGITLVEKLNDLYMAYGYCLNTLHSFKFDGSAGMQRMDDIMDSFRAGVQSFGKEKVVKTIDYLQGHNGLPKSNVLKFDLDNGSIVVRPSGTEPKLKVYFSLSADNREKAVTREKSLLGFLMRWIR